MNKKEIDIYTTCYTQNFMSMAKLQQEVERLILEEKLPFEMGTELIKRWTVQ